MASSPNWQFQLKKPHNFYYMTMRYDDLGHPVQPTTSWINLCRTATQGLENVQVWAQVFNISFFDDNSEYGHSVLASLFFKAGDQKQHLCTQLNNLFYHEEFKFILERFFEDNEESTNLEQIVDKFEQAGSGGLEELIKCTLGQEPYLQQQNFFTPAFSAEWSFKELLENEPPSGIQPLTPNRNSRDDMTTGWTLLSSGDQKAESGCAFELWAQYLTVFSGDKPKQRLVQLFVHYEDSIDEWSESIPTFNLKQDLTDVQKLRDLYQSQQTVLQQSQDFETCLKLVKVNLLKIIEIDEEKQKQDLDAFLQGQKMDQFEHFVQALLHQRPSSHALNYTISDVGVRRSQIMNPQGTSALNSIASPRTTMENFFSKNPENQYKWVCVQVDDSTILGLVEIWAQVQETQEQGVQVTKMPTLFIKNRDQSVHLDLTKYEIFYTPHFSDLCLNFMESGDFDFIQEFNDFIESMEHEILLSQHNITAQEYPELKNVMEFQEWQKLIRFGKSDEKLAYLLRNMPPSTHDESPKARKDQLTKAATKIQNFYRQASASKEREHRTNTKKNLMKPLARFTSQGLGTLVVGARMEEACDGINFPLIEIIFTQIVSGQDHFFDSQTLDVSQYDVFLGDIQNAQFEKHLETFANKQGVNLYQLMGYAEKLIQKKASSRPRATQIQIQTTDYANPNMSLVQQSMLSPNSFHLTAEKQFPDQMSQEQAALIIQAGFRGYQARKDYRLGIHAKQRQFFSELIRKETQEGTRISLAVKNQGSQVSTVEVIKKFRNGTQQKITADLNDQGIQSSTQFMEKLKDYVSDHLAVSQQQLTTVQLKKEIQQLVRGTDEPRIPLLNVQSSQSVLMSAATQPEPQIQNQPTPHQHQQPEVQPEIQEQFEAMPPSDEELSLWSGIQANAPEDQNLQAVRDFIDNEQPPFEIIVRLYGLIDFRKLTYQNVVDLSQNPLIAKFHYERVVQALLSVIETQRVETDRQQQIQESPSPVQKKQIYMQEEALAQQREPFQNMKENMMSFPPQPLAQPLQTPKAHQEYLLHYPKQPAAEKQMKPQLLERVPQTFHYNSRNQGAIYYLGTSGYTQPYKNPATSHIVRAFSSTLYSGRPANILSEPENNASAVKCITQNQLNQFAGVVLQGKRLLPTAYSFENTQLWQMTSWQLQASNDMKKWVILDKRDFAGACPTGVQCWGIRADTQKVYPDGFTAFRIQQVTANSRARHNLSISSFELFGKPVNPELWYF